MAAGRMGGYRDYDMKDRDSGFDVSAKEEYERGRGRNRESNKSRGWEVRDRVRVRPKEIKDRELGNGSARSSSRSDSGSSGGPHGINQSVFLVRAMDREPGELSSESGSDDATDSGLQFKNSEAPKVAENGIRSPPEKKRKFSPIVWDRDVKEETVSLRHKVAKAVTDSSLPLPKEQRQSPNVVLDTLDAVPTVRTIDHEYVQPSSLAESSVALGSDEFSASGSPMMPSSASIRKPLESDLEAENLGDDDYVPTRNISSSRWAAGNNSPGDEGEILDKEIPKRRKTTPISESLEGIRFQRKSLTPEIGEVMRHGSEAGTRSSESTEHGDRSRSSSGNHYLGNDFEKFEGTELGDEIHRSDTSSSRLDNDSEDETESPEEAELSGPPPRNVNMLQGCRSVDEFERLNKIDEGTYGVVYRARDKKSGEIVALKKVKMEKEREGFPMTSLREINILLSFHHPSIVDVKEVVVGSSLDSIFMVMEYMEHDLKALMETMKQPFSQSEVKCLMLQLLEGVKYLHDNWVLHRDLKTSNLLLNNQGELKICDFGLARQYGSPLKTYTHMVVTLWYRAPELLLGTRQYSTAIDMWSLGCIMAELLSKQPLFNGKTEVDQLDKIFRMLGTPNETIWPGFSNLPGVRVNFVKHQYNLLRKKFPATSFTGSPVLSDSGFDLLNKLLTYDPEKRITAEAALNHEWFSEVPLPKSKAFMPTFPAQHAQDRRFRRVMKSPDPLEEQRRKELQQGELGTSGLFG
ncbi:cyclin-dependent kinase G-2-like isoform X1 [Cucurbita pepo subsp. pepo]|uniref:cyclin-dependent kinase G-2-like isoform X1 n=1 Tax=Cucurbita pepo subsp. pepo TaxID=3664 RepID=UPI000C9D9DBB|nr:cyclin-dependent kinase G-2-like isoform X1 [Cucurbita pepo subsp. pepo]XP_023541533.1 cyclin-dependent kinase G-2-like isoform X1 [Cucurbita pepo subsp. pepo]XP_023541534.1 cyclin-dependent kinase G-2-like isoform X1 [Cucurbita pepo subsp. pepo]XP_023541535.1 cyclin-dependent kinase G-2-like isoform X1 [Cucurbita pepo subsp. pepo]XP_023541536.1 cyclin-dependent kinase G-2-like isoform X1 [Cucurbita pepo subsp. pepo]XP_023541537.1 cyclin-dependent kinase G-2-like isoform X1 [Cucurbita pepo 